MEIPKSKKSVAQVAAGNTNTAADYLLIGKRIAQNDPKRANLKIGKSRAYAITIYEECELDSFHGLDSQYSIFGIEFCPSTGRRHYQCYIYFKNARWFHSLKAEMPTSHIEKAYDTPSVNIAYCKKDGSFVENGDPPQDPGKSSQLALALENCQTLGELMDEYPEVYLRFNRGLGDIYARRDGKQRFERDVNVIWLWGTTGGGKTFHCFKNDATPVIFNNGFFSDWYEARIIALEEFRGEIPLRILLQLTDRYHNYYRVNIKGGTKLVDVDTVFITSCFKPTELYQEGERNSPEDIAQLLRRIKITEVIRLS